MSEALANTIMLIGIGVWFLFMFVLPLCWAATAAIRDEDDES